MTGSYLFLRTATFYFFVPPWTRSSTAQKFIPSQEISLAFLLHGQSELTAHSSFCYYEKGPMVNETEVGFATFYSSRRVHVPPDSTMSLRFILVGESTACPQASTLEGTTDYIWRFIFRHPVALQTTACTIWGSITGTAQYLRIPPLRDLSSLSHRRSEVFRAHTE